MEKKEFHGAGFFLIDPVTNLILALVNNHGLYDFPKGVREGTELPLETAIRECFEECSILIEEKELMNCGPFREGGLVIFCAETLKKPAIFPNEKTGILEHTSYKWLKPEEFESNCVEYLKPVLQKIVSTLIKQSHPLTLGHI
jgi:8-oxo-dGTP pyrophosphatase MutT (NUDIX family)